MANNTIGWGQGATNNDIGWGRGSTNDIGWGSVYENSYVGDTDLVGVTYLLDTYAGAAAAYSLRQLKSGVTNVVRVRADVVGQPEQDFTAAQITDGTLATFVGAGNNGYVVTWYDQSGSGNHATQGTAANQPQIVASGVVITQGGMPSIRFNGSTSYFNTSSNPFTFTGGLSVIHASYKSVTSYKDFETILSAGATGNATNNLIKCIGLGYGNSAALTPIPSIVTDIWSPSGIQYDGTVSISQRHLIGYYINNWSTHRSTGLSNLRLNGSDLATKTYRLVNPTSLNSDPIRIGCFDTVLATSFFNGDIQEIIAYPSDQSTNRTGIEGNINGYYSIY